MLKKRVIWLAMVIVSMVLFGCKQNNLNADFNDNQRDTTKKSKLADDLNFKESLHLIKNNVTNTETIVKGDGTIILNGMDGFKDVLGLAKDKRTNEVNYVYRSIYGEDREIIERIDNYSGEVYSYSEPTIETIYYDNTGKEIGLRAKSYSPNLILGDKIVYSDLNSEYGSNLYYFDVKTKKTEKTKHNSVYFYADHPIFSTNQYIEKNEINKEILVCDDDFNVIKTIDNYSISGIENASDTEIAVVATTLIKNNEKSPEELDYGTDYEYKYNCLDTDFNLVFDEPLDSRPIFNDSSVVTVHRGNIEFDFDFKNMKKVGEERAYSGFDNYNDKYQTERRKYDPICDDIKKLDNRYTYVDVRIYKDKVLLFAHHDDSYDEKNDIFIDPCDIYSVDKELLLSVKTFNNTYEDAGYIFVDNNKIYDFDLNLIKSFDTELYVDKYDIGGKTYFEDSRNVDYSTREHFNLYDNNMNLLYENLRMAIPYTYDDCLILVFDDKTIIIDKDNNIIKEFDRALDIRNWYDDVDYKVFTDINTNRMGILDDNDNVIIDGLKYVSGLEKECFTFTNGFKYGLMDYEGKVICSFSIFNTMNEDAKLEDYNIRLLD